MSNMIKKYHVTIFDESLALVSDQHEEHVQLSACRVDEIIQEIANKSPHVEPKKIALLAALKLASMLVACEREKVCTQTKEQEILAYLECELSNII